MSPKLERQPESVQFRAELESILDVPLTPENIDNYADNALGKLVELVQSVRASFQETTTQTFSNHRELENTAFQRYGLEDIEQILDHVATKSEELRELDDLICKVFTEQAVLVPPDPDSFIEPGEDPEPYEQPRTVPRLKTLLFVLANEFEVDVHDSEAVNITTGVLEGNMVRGESYNLVDIPSLERTVLLCDEVGNVTFVLDRSAMEDADITPEDIATLTKNEIKDLLEDHSTLGQTIKYHPSTYVAGLADALNDIQTLESKREESSSYLWPDVQNCPQEVMSINAIGKKWGVGHAVISRAIDNLVKEGKLKEPKKYLIRTVPRVRLDADQQAMIYQHLEKKGLFTEPASEGVLSKPAIAKEWAIDRGTISKAINQMIEEGLLSELNMYQFGNIRTVGLNSEQKTILYQYLEEKGAFSEPAPEEIDSLKAIAQKWGLGRRTIEKVITELAEEELIGEVNHYKFSGNYSIGLDSTQQSILYKRLEMRGLFKPPAPEGVLSLTGFRKIHGATQYTAKKAFETAVNEGVLGEVNYYRFGTQVTVGLSVEQQEILHQYLTLSSKEAKSSPGESK